MSPTLEMTGFLPKLANFMLERKQDASGGGGGIQSPKYFKQNVRIFLTTFLFCDFSKNKQLQMLKIYTREKEIIFYLIWVIIFPLKSIHIKWGSQRSNNYF